MKMSTGDVLVQSAAGRDKQIFDMIVVDGDSAGAVAAARPSADIFYSRSSSVHASSLSVPAALILFSSESHKFISDDPRARGPSRRG
jgi:hypothetical protein